LRNGAMQQQPARKTKRAAFSGRHVAGILCGRRQVSTGRPLQSADVKISNLRKIPVPWKN
jgi:hypothetical protein